ncbi:MAG: hypothetical protein WBD31_10015 [Rubripirellula sp.]
MRWIPFRFYALVAIAVSIVVVPAMPLVAAQSSGLEDVIAYNQAVDLYRDGQLGDAAALFQTVAASSDSALAAKARYNLGNSLYGQAVNAIESKDPEAKSTAVEMLRSAIAHYRSGLRLDPSDDDARANIESAAKLIQQLEQPDSQPSESQQPDNEPGDESAEQDSKNQEPSNQDSEGEQSPGDESGQGPKDPQDSSGADQPQQSPESSEQGEDAEQSKGDQQPEESGKKNGESDQQTDGDSDGAEQDEASPSQDEANGQEPGDQQKPGDQDEGKEGSPTQQDPMPGQDQPGNEEPLDGQQQGNPDDKGETSAGELTESEPSESSADQPDSSEVASVAAEQSGEMTPQEARKMLQAIRDRDMIRRLRQKAAARDQRVMVDRDW